MYRFKKHSASVPPFGNPAEEHRALQGDHCSEMQFKGQGVGQHAEEEQVAEGVLQGFLILCLGALSLRGAELEGLGGAL